MYVVALIVPLSLHFYIIQPPLPLCSGQPVCGFGDPGRVAPLPVEALEGGALSLGHTVALGLGSHQSEVFYGGLLMPLEAALQKSGARQVNKACRRV